MAWHRSFQLLWYLFFVSGSYQSSSSSSSSPYDNEDHVLVLKSVRDFDEHIASSSSIWMIHFFNNNNHNNNPQDVQVFGTVSKLMKGIFKLAAVDKSSEAGTSLASQLRTKAPSVIVLGDDKAKVAQTVDVLEIQKLLDAFMTVTSTTISERFSKAGFAKPSGGSSSSGFSGSGGSKTKNRKKSNQSEVLQLTGTNFDTLVYQNPLVVMVAFTAPWCGHCQRLLPEWEEAARRLAGEGAVLGWLDATAENALAQQYGVRGYPTIKVFPGGVNKQASDAMDYPGERTASAIVKHMLAEVDRTGVPKQIEEMTSMEVLQHNCGGQNHICVLAALPHIVDSGADGRNKYRDRVAGVAKSFRGSAFSFLWFQGGSQTEFETALQLTFGFPALVAFSLDRKAYAVLHGSFTDKAMTSFLHAITTGRQATIPLSHVPNVKTVTPWDGQDAAPVEDEIPLSEIMGWDEEDEL